MKKENLAIDQLLFNYHWHCINSLRAGSIKLLERGTACNDPRLVERSNRILTHGMEVSRIWRLHHSGISVEADSDEDITACL